VHTPAASHFSPLLFPHALKCFEGFLTALVYGGAMLYVISKSSKFSLFKPSEEVGGWVGVEV
jgi:hypothetical protein